MAHYFIKLVGFIVDWVKDLFKVSADAEEAVSAESPSSPTQTYLIVGLGNIGRKYRTTRHNVGFMAVDKLASAHGITSNRVEHKAIVGKFNLDGNSVIIAKPQTMMNLSGNAVGPLAKYYKIPVSNVLVVYDELDLAFGTLRLRGKGGAGGHNGMRSIINHLGNDFPRLRIGVGRPPGRMPAAAYVLRDFDKREIPELEFLLNDVVKAIETYIRDGIELAMTRHNITRQE